MEKGRLACRNGTRLFGPLFVKDISRDGHHTCVPIFQYSEALLFEEEPKLQHRGKTSNDTASHITSIRPCCMYDPYGMGRVTVPRNLRDMGQAV